MALTTARAAGNLAGGIAMATEAIDSGRAHRVLEDLIAFTRAVA
jgi:anthranilate phosphoribosyltransferase